MDELVKRLREFASIPEHCENVESCDGCSKENICLSFTNERIIEIASKAADAIEKLQATLCNWCAVCPEDKRDLSTCEIYESCRAKPPKEET